jgi:hypothetical protein
VSARNVCALLHHLMEGTYVPSVKNSYMDLVAFLMVMIVQSPTAINAFLAMIPMKEVLCQPLQCTATL